MNKKKRIFIIFIAIISVVITGIFMGKDMTANDTQIVQVTFTNNEVTKDSVGIHVKAQCLEGYEIKAMQADEQPRVENVTELDFVAMENREYIVKVYYQSLAAQEELTETFTTTVDYLSNDMNAITPMSSEMENTNNPENFELDENGIIVKYNGSKDITQLVLPEMIGDKKVIGIAADNYRSLFENCSALTSVIIPNSFMSLGNHAFASCSSLKSVTLPDSIKSIGIATFAECTGLTSIIIPNSVESIGNSAFNSCTSLTTVTIGNSVKMIGEYTFSGCTSLSSITLGSSVTEIGIHAFSGCELLTSITIPESVRKLNISSFIDCISLESVVISSSLTEIDYSVFYNCPLKNLVIMTYNSEQIDIPDDSPIWGIEDINKISVYRVVVKGNIETKYNDIKFYEHMEKSMSLNQMFQNKGVSKVVYTGMKGDEIYTGNNILVPDSYFDESIKYSFIGEITSDNTVIKDHQFTIGKDEKLKSFKVQAKSLNTSIEIPVMMISAKALTIKSEPQKIYNDGDMYNPKGLILTMTYEDEYQEDITYSDEKKSDFHFKYDKLNPANTKQFIEYKRYIVEHELTVNDNYVDKVLSDDDLLVTIKGKLTNNSYVLVEKMRDMEEKLGNDLEGENIIAYYEVRVIGNYQDELVIIFDVDEIYNNEKVYIRHLKKDGNIDKYEEMVVDGKIEITVNELSPFLIYVNKDKQDTHSNNNETIIPPIDNKVINANNDSHNDVIPNSLIKGPAQKGVIIKDYQSVKTSDMTNIFGYVLLAGLSLLFINRQFLKN